MDLKAQLRVGQGRIAKVAYRHWLLAAFLVLFPLSWINAASTIDLVLQHTPTVLVLAILIATDRRHPLGNLSFTMLFAYVMLHVLGARYLYSFVPYDSWAEQCFGVNLSDLFGWERNHYDRLVYLCFGLLVFFPAREIVMRLMGVRVGWSFAVAVGLIVVLGTVYELAEWFVAMVMSPQAAENYNGQRGDVWDAHRDMALALGGAVFSALLAAGLQWRATAARIAISRPTPAPVACEDSIDVHESASQRTARDATIEFSAPSEYHDGNQ